MCFVPIKDSHLNSKKPGHPKARANQHADKTTPNAPRIGLNLRLFGLTAFKNKITTKHLLLALEMLRTDELLHRGILLRTFSQSRDIYVV